MKWWGDEVMRGIGDEFFHEITEDTLKRYSEVYLVSLITEKDFGNFVKEWKKWSIIIIQLSSTNSQAQDRK